MWEQNRRGHGVIAGWDSNRRDAPPSTDRGDPIRSLLFNVAQRENRPQATPLAILAPRECDMTAFVDGYQAYPLTNHRTAAFLSRMREMLRASKLMALLFRLVMILSLAGYSVSTVDAAMHPAEAGGMQHDQSAMIDHGAMMDHGGSTMMSDSHDHNDMTAEHDSGAQKTAKPQCCGDFCLGMAVLISHDTTGRPVVNSIRSFLDDSKALGQTPLLHRPPNI